VSAADLVLQTPPNYYITFNAHNVFFYYSWTRALLNTHYFIVKKIWIYIMPIFASSILLNNFARPSPTNDVARWLSNDFFSQGGCGWFFNMHYLTITSWWWGVYPPILHHRLTATSEAAWTYAIDGHTKSYNRGWSSIHTYINVWRG